MPVRVALGGLVSSRGREPVYRSATVSCWFGRRICAGLRHVNAVRTGNVLVGAAGRDRGWAARVVWKTLAMSSGLPRTVKAVDTSELIRLDAEAIECGLNRNHGAGWLVEFADPAAVHYLWPVLVHRAGHRPESSPHWRCMLLLTVRDGQQVFSLLDVLPASFEDLPETLDAAMKTEVAHRLNCGGLPTQAQWSELNS